MQKRILSLLVLLMTAATGAWADETLLLTIESKDYASFKSGSKTFDDKVTITFSSSVRNDGDTDGWFGSSVFSSLLTVTGTNGYTITSCKFYTNSGTANTGYTVEGESPSVYLSEWAVFTDASKSVNIGEPGVKKIEVYTASAASGYSVSLKSSTEDATNWQGKAGTGDYQSMPLTGLEASTAVSVKYSGTKIVKSVKAVKKAAAAAARTLAEVTAGDIGKIVGKDGKIYATKADAEAVATGNAVAMIAYVGTASDCTHGLAIALADESAMKWGNAGTACSGKEAVTGGTWRLPSIKDWQYMLIGCGASGSYSDNPNQMSCSELASKLNTAQGDALQTGHYWSSTEAGNEYVWTVYFGGDYAPFYNVWEGFEYRVRACLAFTVEQAAPASTTLNNTMTAWTAGTYAVPAGGLTYSDAITVSGDVTLTLTDGQTLTLNNGISLAEGATLTIQGNGTMNINGTDGNTSSTVGGNHGTLVLTSGTLTATGGNGGSVDAVETDAHGGNGGVAINGSVIVSGGSLTARGGNGGSVDYQSTNCSGGNGGDAISGSVTVSGGTLTATGGNGGSVGELGSDCSGGNGGDAISGTLTKNGGSTSVNDGSNGSIGNMCDNCTAGTGGTSAAGSGGDIPNSDPYTPGGDPFSF